jgi:ribA/ribD-fused uncharacterized protein
MKSIGDLRTKDELVEFVARRKKAKYLCFWGHTKNKSQEVSKTCFSQWYGSKFEIDGIVYPTAEHFMMAEKARIFESNSAANTVLLEKIIEAPHPQKAKQLGRQIEGFTNEIWNQHRFDVVVRGNVAKFSQNLDLAEFLLGTGKRVLVEASPADKVWGTGLAEDHEDAINPFKWKGLNLLGFALMEARSILMKTKEL